MGIGVFGCIKILRNHCSSSMFKAVLLLCSVTSALAGMKNSAKYGNTVLKYYVDQQDTTTFGAAVLSCIQKGGEMVMPKDKKLNDAVAKVAQGNIAWIGGGDQFGEGKFEWNDGKNHEWTNWLQGEPNAKNENEDCMEINRGSKGKWNDEACCSRRGYVCQIPNKKSEPYENSAFTAYDGYTDQRSHLQAEQFCKRHQSRLVLLRDHENFPNLLSKLENPIMTQFWVNSEQDGNPCIIVSDNGVSDADCLQSLPFICEQVAVNDLSVSEEQPFVEPGINLNIKCSASGTPIPKVTWYRDDTYVPHQRHGLGSSTLVLEDIGFSDFGTYVCKAVNEVGGQLKRMEGFSFVESSTTLE